MKLITIKPNKVLVDTRALQKELTEAMEDTVTDGIDFMTDYPPQVLNKTGYVRTGTLGRSWMRDAKTSNVRVTADRIEGVIGSAGPEYNKYVQGEKDTQSRLMRGAGWQSVDDLIKRVVEPKLKARLRAIFRGLR